MHGILTLLLSLYTYTQEAVLFLQEACNGLTDKLCITHEIIIIFVLRCAKIHISMIIIMLILDVQVLSQHDNTISNCLVVDNFFLYS